MWSKSVFIWNDDKEIMLIFQLKTQKLMICQICWEKKKKEKEKEKRMEIEMGSEKDKMRNKRI